MSNWTASGNGITRQGRHYVSPGKPIIDCPDCGARVVPITIPPRNPGKEDEVKGFTVHVDYPLEEPAGELLGDGWGKPHRCRGVSRIFPPRK